MNANFYILALAKLRKNSVNNFLFILMGLLLIFSLDASAQLGCNLSHNFFYYGGFEASENNFGPNTASTNYIFKTTEAKQGEYQILTANDLNTPKSYKLTKPNSGAYFFATHTSTDPAETKIWYKTLTVSQGQKFNISAYIASLKELPINGFSVNIVINDGTSSITFTGLTILNDWVQISGIYTVLPGVKTIEVKIIDPSPSNILNLGSHFLALDDICISEVAGSPLPINLVDFTATKQNKVVDLNWQTSNEENSSHFDVEFSRDGGKFESIGKVKASVSSTTLKNYSLKHLSPVNGLNYYRLKMVDIDASSKYSAVRTVKFSKLTSIAVMPNPTTDRVYITSNEVGILQSVGLYTMSGKLLQQINNFTLGKSIDLSTYSPSVYILKLIDKNGSTEVIKIERK